MGRPTLTNLQVVDVTYPANLDFVPDLDIVSDDPNRYQIERLCSSESHSAAEGGQDAFSHSILASL